VQSNTGKKVTVFQAASTTALQVFGVSPPVSVLTQLSVLTVATQLAESTHPNDPGAS